jgi:conjugative relaxase-like TrwC/TraI family protein
MLSIKHISADNQEDVDYYEKDETLVQAIDEYYGKAESKSLSGRLTQAVWDYDLGGEYAPKGAVLDKDFKQIFHGVIPETGEALREEKKNEADKNILGIDLTYSVPKSVSIQLHVGKDDRIFDVIMQAALECNQILKERYIRTRIQKNGDRRSVKTGNAAIVMIPHHTSRDGDMQTHIHAVLMNGTRGADGKLRSLDDYLIKKAHIRSLGNIFENKVAAGLQNLGYEIEYTNKGWELKGYTRKDILTFSKRSKAMLNYLEEKSLEATPENKQQAVLKTRKTKKIESTLEQMRDAWSNESDVAPQIPKDAPVPPIGSHNAAEELESAIRHLSERNVSFDQEDIEQYVFKRPQNFDEVALAQAIADHKELIPVPGSPGRFMTLEALDRETKTNLLWLAGQGKAQPLKIEATLENSFLNSGQAEVALKTLLSTDKHQIWHGFAGVGKTTTLKEVKAQLEGTDYVIRGYATTINAAETLQKEVGIPTQTVQHLVLSQPEKIPNQIWFVDEVGMLGAEDGLTLVEKAQSVGARIIMAGDKGQNSPVKAGSFLRSLMAHGATTHHLNKIIRQQNDIQRQAVELIAHGDGLGALTLLNNHGYVTEIKDARERAIAATEKFLGLSQKERNKTRIVTGTNAERLRITKILRENLKAEGELSESVKVVQLVSRQFTTEEKRRVENYQQGDYLYLRTPYPGAALKKGLYKVEKVDGKELVVSTAGGRLYRIDPARQKGKHSSYEVFYAQEMEIAVGDRLRWTTSDKEHGRINGRHLKVTAIDETTMTVQDVSTKKIQQVSLLEPLAMDYNWVVTSYRSQAGTYTGTIASTTDDPTSSREPFYVTISRQKHKLIVFTQDYAQLQTWVQRSSAQENPLELLIGGTNGTNNHRSRTGTAESAGDDQPIDGANAAISTREQRIALKDGSDVERSADRHEARTTELPGRVSPGDRESQTLGISASHPGIGGNAQGTTRPDQQLGIHSRGYDNPNKSGSERDQRIDESLIQQRLDQIKQQITEHLSRKTEHDLIESQVVSSEHTSVRQLGHMRETMEYIADAIASEQFEQYFSQNTLLDEIQSLSTAIIALPHHPAQRTRYEGMEEIADALSELSLEEHSFTQNIYNIDQRLVDAIAKQQFETEINECAGLIREADYQLNRIDYQKNMGAMADAIAEMQIEQSLQDVSATLSEINQSIEIATRRSRMTAVADALTQWRAEQEFTEAIAQLSHELQPEALERLTQATEQVRQLEQLRPDIEMLVDLVQEWQSEQELIEAFHDGIDGIESSPTAEKHRYQGVQEIIEGLYNLDEEQLLSEEAVVEVINNLNKTVASLNKPKYQGMVKLAEAINNRHAVEAIEEHLAIFQEATTQLQENLQHNPGLEKLAETVRSLRNNPAIAEATNEHLQQISQRLREFGLSTTPKPEKLEPFWVPEYREGDRPGHIDEKHWQEMTESAIHPKLIAANVRSIEGPTVLQYLLEEKLDTLGGESGQYATEDVKKLFKRYKPLAAGGWWGSAGIDAVSLEHLQPSDKPVLSNWGAFKGDNPRIDYQKSQSKGKTQYIKYEHPLGVERHLYLPVVPEKLTDRSLSKHGIERTDQEQDSSYWQMVKDHPEIPINLGEGFKKTLASISQGDVQIGGSGVNAFYRSRDAQGRKLPERVLNEQLAVFAVPGRLFRFTFDQDAKPSTVRNVRRDMVRTIELLESRGCICKVVYWEGDKGLDDLIAHQGPRTYAKAIATAQCAEREKRIHYRTEYKTIAHQVRKTNSGITQENLDCEVFLRAIAKGDLNDGERFMSQSDHASTLKSPVEVQTYVEHIKAIAPQYFQQQRELTKAQVAMRRQQQQDRSEYETIAQRVRKDPSNVNVIDQIIDLQVYLIAEAERGAGHGDTLIAQSDHVLNRPYPIDVQQYIDQIREHVSLHQQTLQDQSEYETLATEARAELPTEATPLEVDALVYFELRDQGRLEDSERILRFSPHLRSIESLDSAKQYLQKVRLASQHYEQDTVRRDRLIQRIKVGNDLVNLKVVEQLGLDVMAIMSNGQPYTNDKLFNFEKNRSGAIRISLKDGTTVYENGKVNPDVERAILDRLEFTLPKAMENIKRDIAQQVDQQKGMHRDRDIDLEQ